MNFIFRHSCFPQSYYSGSKVITPDPELLLRIQSYYSRSKVFTLHPKLFLRIQSFLLWIQSYYSGSKVSYCGSKVITPDPKFLTVAPKLLLRIQSYYSGSKVISPDPKFLLWIQSYHSGSKVFTLDPKFLLWIQIFHSGSKVIAPETKIQSNLIFRYWSMNTWRPVHHSTWRWGWVENEDLRPKKRRPRSISLTIEDLVADLIRTTRSEFSQGAGWAVSIENGFQIFTPLVVSIKLIKGPKGRKTQTLLCLLLHLEPPPWVGRKRRPPPPYING